MNKITKFFRRIFKCSRGDHVIHLSHDEMQLLDHIKLRKLCQVCGKVIITEGRDESTYWEIEDANNNNDEEYNPDKNDTKMDR